MKNRIYLRRKNKLILEKGTGHLHKRYIASIMKNIEGLGYILSKEVVEILQTYNMSELMEFYKFLVYELSVLVGAHRVYRPMYPNFPAQVMEVNEAELYFNAIIHYISGALPVYKKKKRPELKEDTELKIISLGDEADFMMMFKKIMSAKIAISVESRIDLEEYIKLYLNRADEILPQNIPNKENLAYLVSNIYGKTKSMGTMGKYFRTAKDVLRFAVALSEGDISLAAATRFRRFKRSERRMILELLEGCEDICEDMNRNREFWLRLGEMIHPGEYKKRFPKAYEGFYSIRNKKEVYSFNRIVEKLLIEKDIDNVVKVLSKRPGEFARRIDKLLRMGVNNELVLEAFRKVAADVASPLILQMYNHFSNRNLELELRVFFPKGQVSKAYAIDNNLPKLQEDVRIQIVDICRETLINNYAQRGDLGRVYVDPGMEKFNVPFSQRTASKALKTIPKGSRIKLSDKNFLRFFLYWREGLTTGRVDIDLTLSVFDSEWGHIEDIAYYNLKGSKFKIYHSGDITEAPYGASEFIDVNRKSVVDNGGRYLVLNVSSFTQQPYCNLPECFCGWMERAGMNSGEIYEPSTVENKFDLSADMMLAIPAIVDLYEKEVIWSDMSLATNPNYMVNAAENSKGIFLMGKAITTLRKPDLFQLFRLHGEARGTLVEDEREADTIFSVEKGTTPYDIEEIISSYI